MKILLQLIVFLVMTIVETMRQNMRLKSIMCVRTSPSRDTSREIDTLLIRLLRQYLFINTLGSSTHVKVAYKKGVFRAFKVSHFTLIPRSS